MMAGLDIAATINEILAENPNAEIMVICGYGEGREEYSEEDGDEVEDDEKMPLETDSWFSDAFWDSILSNDIELVASGGGGGGGTSEDAILMDNPLQS